MDEVDAAILSILAGNSRTSLRRIASRIGLPYTTVYSRIRRMEEKGVIQRYTVLLDHSKLGYRITAVTQVSVQGRYIESLEKLVAGRREAVAVYDITGEYDMLVIARFKSIEELDSFIKWLNKLEGVERTVSSVVFRVVKEDPASMLS